jgi:hypothetical protein
MTLAGMIVGKPMAAADFVRNWRREETGMRFMGVVWLKAEL